MPTVSIPNVGEVQFPDSMAPDEILAKAKEIHQNSVKPTTSMAPAGPPPGQGPVGNQEIAQNVVASQGAKGFLQGPGGMLAAGVLPGVGAGVGGMVAKGLTFPGSRLAGEMIGAGVGEVANQATGITEPSAPRAGLAAAGPAIGRAVTGGLQAAKKFWPGSRGAAETLNTAAADEATQMVDRLRPTGPTSQQLFQAARAQQVTLPATQTLQAADNGINELLTLSKGAQDLHRPAVKYLQGLKQKIQTQGGTLNPDELQNEMAALGDITSSLTRGGKPGARFLAKVRDALLDDLDTAATTANPAQPAAQTLQAARKTFLKEKTVEEVQEAIERATKLNRGQGEAVQFNANQVVAELKGNRFYTKAFSPAEQADVEKTLKLLNKVPALPSGAGQTFGSGQFWQQAGKVGAGAALGTMTGMGTGMGAAVGAGAGTALPLAAGLSKNISLALQTGQGRALLRQIFQHGVTQRSAAVLGAYLTETGASGASLLE